MGFGTSMRIFKEGINKHLDGKSSSFESTSLERCTRLVEQLNPVEKALNKYLSTVTDFKGASRELMVNTRVVLALPTPRPGENVAGSAIGHMIDLEPLTSLDETRLHNSVVSPIERWLAEFKTVKNDRLDVLDKVRLELDSRRRQEVELKDALTKLQVQVAPSDGAKLDKHNRNIDYAAQRLAHKQQKMAGVAKTFEEQEAAVWQNLEALATDVALIPAYMAGTLGVFKEIFNQAVDAFPYDMRSTPGTTAIEASDHNEAWHAAMTPKPSPSNYPASTSPGATMTHTVQQPPNPFVS